MIFKTFGSFCSRLTAGALAIPAVLAGIGIVMAGSVAALGLAIPGLAAGLAVRMATGDAAAGVLTFCAVSLSVVSFGVAVGVGGAVAAEYAATEKSAIAAGINRGISYINKREDEDEDPGIDRGVNPK